MGLRFFGHKAMRPVTQPEEPIRRRDTNPSPAQLQAEAQAVARHEQERRWQDQVQAAAVEREVASRTPTPTRTETVQPRATSSVTQRVETEGQRQGNEEYQSGDTGKAGTITDEEFKFLGGMIDKYGPEIVSLKIGKICKKKADGLKREFSRSIVAKAYEDLANKIEGLF